MSNLPALWLIVSCVLMILVLGWQGALAIMVLAAVIFGVMWMKWWLFDRDQKPPG